MRLVRKASRIYHDQFDKKDVAALMGFTRDMNIQLYFSTNMKDFTAFTA